MAVLNYFASHHSFKSKVTRHFFCRYPEFQWYLIQSNLDFPNLDCPDFFIIKTYILGPTFDDYLLVTFEINKN